MRNYPHYDMTIKQKKWKKYVTKNHKTIAVAFAVKIQRKKMSTKRPASGLFLACSQFLAWNFGQNRGSCSFKRNRSVLPQTTEVELTSLQV